MSKDDTKKIVNDKIEFAIKNKDFNNLAELVDKFSDLFNKTEMKNLEKKLIKNITNAEGQRA